VNVEMVEVEDPSTGCSTLVPRGLAPADGVVDPTQTFVVEAVPGQPDLCIVRWWYGLEECVSQDRIPRVAIAPRDPWMSPAADRASTVSHQLTGQPPAGASRVPAGTQLTASWGSDGAALCADERRVVACACGRRELAHPHSPMRLAGTCRDCLPGRPAPPAELLYYPHVCFSPN
jgi:hypothetical protein